MGPGDFRWESEDQTPCCYSAVKSGYKMSITRVFESGCMRSIIALAEETVF